jgi:hypothetical protein
LDSEPGPKLPFGLGKRLPRHVDGRREPMRERETRQQRECPLRLAEAFFAPARVRQAKAMTPVVAFKRNRNPIGGSAGSVANCEFEHEPERRAPRRTDRDGTPPWRDAGLWPTPLQSGSDLVISNCIARIGHPDVRGGWCGT